MQRLCGLLLILITSGFFVAVKGAPVDRSHIVSKDVRSEASSSLMAGSSDFTLRYRSLYESNNHLDRRLTLPNSQQIKAFSIIALEHAVRAGKSIGKSLVKKVVIAYILIFLATRLGIFKWAANGVTVQAPGIHTSIEPTKASSKKESKKESKERRRRSYISSEVKSNRDVIGNMRGMRSPMDRVSSSWYTAENLD